MLPELYARWLDELLGDECPPERHATCDACAMCEEGASGPARPGFFEPSTKCCTFMPSLPNFLVGRILADPDPPASIDARITAGLGCTPLGLARTPTYELLYEHGRTRAFGRSQALRCPHLDAGRCTIWRHREATCATWFCKHERGQVGAGFWREGVQALLQTIERELAEYCVLQAGFDAATLSRLLARRRPELASERLGEHELDGHEDPELGRALWGASWGREREYFRACAARIEGLAWADVLAICSPRVGLMEKVLRSRFDALRAETLPTRARLGELVVLGRRGDRVRLRGYSEFDPLDVAPLLLELLPHFDGRTLADVRAAMLDELGVELDDALVRRLLDFGVLVEPDDG